MFYGYCPERYYFLTSKSNFLGWFRHFFLLKIGNLNSHLKGTNGQHRHCKSLAGPSNFSYNSLSTTLLDRILFPCELINLSGKS
jgi:hypothetical protein